MKSLAFKIVKTAENETASTILKPELCTLDLHHTEEENGATVTLGDLNEILQESHLFSEVVAYLKKFFKTEPLLPLLEFKSDELNRKERTKMSFDDAEKELREYSPSQEVSFVTEFVCILMNEELKSEASVFMIIGLWHCLTSHFESS